MAVVTAASSAAPAAAAAVCVYVYVCVCVIIFWVVGFGMCRLLECCSMHTYTVLVLLC